MRSRLVWFSRAFVACLTAASLAACGGGGGSSPAPIPVSGSTSTPTPTPAPTLAPTSTQSLPVGSSASAALALPAIAAGFAASGTVPAATSGSATLTATLSATNPSAVAPQTMRRAPAAIGAQNGSVGALAYLALTANAALTLPALPAFTFTVPSGASAPNGFWLAVLDESQPGLGWTVLGKASSSTAGTATFSGLGGPFAMSANVTYVVLLFAPGGTYPTPSPTPSPSPSPSVLPSPAASATPTPAPTSSPVAACASVRRASGSRRPANASGPVGIVPNQLFVTYRSGGRSVQSAEQAASVVRSVEAGTDATGLHRILTFGSAGDAARAASSLRAQANVAGVAPLHYRRPSGDAVANDPLLSTSKQWYLYKTNVADGAWNVTHGSAAITVAVIDTGVDQTNIDLAPKLDVHESIVNGVVTTSAQDTDGHGTNVAGLAVAQPNNGYGFAGVGWDVHLLAYKIFPDSTPTCASPSASTGDEALAIRAAVDAGASVISMSLGGPQSAGIDAAEQSAVTYALSHNVTVVAAAGNEYPSTDGNQPDYPGAYPGVIAVGATGVVNTTANVYSSITAETIASYSNSGPTVVAPGGDSSGLTDNDDLHWITGYSTTTAGYPADRCSNSGGVCVTLFNGTSQATPQVSGLVALLEAKHGGPRSLTPAAVTTILQQTAVPLPGISPTRQGAGRIDAAAALAQ